MGSIAAEKLKPACSATEARLPLLDRVLARVGAALVRVGSRVVRRGLGMMIESDFYTTEAGRKHFNDSLTSIRYCVQETCNFDVLYVRESPPGCEREPPPPPIPWNFKSFFIIIRVPSYSVFPRQCLICGTQPHNI